jgi:LacI family gluconate utilization system Gnt-I transcriptional repressor
MRDVARLANVSAITVSRALSRPEKVSEEAKERIQWAIDSIGYVHNRVASSLSSNRTGIVAAVVPRIDNPLYGSTLQGLSDVLRQANYRLMLSNSGFYPEDLEALVRTLLGHRPEALFLQSVTVTESTRMLLKRMNIPVVQAGDLTRNPVDVVVSYSNYASARAMTMHLGKRGYKKIGFVCNDVRLNPRALQRKRGYLAALRALGIKPDEELILETTHGFREGQEAMATFAERRPDVEAIFFAAELWAVGAMAECHRRGWKVPRRFAIAGYDHGGIAPQVTPALTAVHIPRNEIGRVAGEILLRRLRGETVENPIVDLGFQIVEGESA